MKALLGLLVMTVAVGWLRAETNLVPAAVSRAQDVPPKVNRTLTPSPITQAAGKIIRKKARVGGFLADFARAPRPLQVINPLRPENAGFETDNLMRDPRTGRAQGIVLLSVRF